MFLYKAMPMYGVVFFMCACKKKPDAISARFALCKTPLIYQVMIYNGFSCLVFPVRQYNARGKSAQGDTRADQETCVVFHN